MYRQRRCNRRRREAPVYIKMQKAEMELKTVTTGFFNGSGNGDYRRAFRKRRYRLHSEITVSAGQSEESPGNRREVPAGAGEPGKMQGDGEGKSSLKEWGFSGRPGWK